ncbi:hypothetical protein HR060_13280 [Catenovulum sp. SM1970]|uniref:hypothetical protein n=1 Tax=Marinifaba aquimaris TaxID=2741323 RepID=UPI0015731BE4|nr:hypothetical protein [Marinifaba aquimaris]NTS77826.1 hypothetical protein [Marinifaba aquimaris]
MAQVEIPLGKEEQLIQLYSFPNIPGSKETLSETILHWFKQTLERDGFASKDNPATAEINVNGDDYTLVITGPDAIEGYKERLPKFHEDGLKALKVIEALKHETRTWPKGLTIPTEDKVWDPQNTGQWRFFMSLGMAMLNQKALNFFHYPPIRLLDPMRDYLNDPVPVRLIELMAANGLTEKEDAWLYSTVMDGAPIAAPDNQGTQYIGEYPNQTAVHLIPINAFHDYQRSQVELLLNTSQLNEAYTVPIVVYGSPACDAFSELYLAPDDRLKPLQTRTVEIIKGKKTAVIGSSHPYRFYAQAQISDNTEVGLGHILPGKCEGATKSMVDDLIVVRWQLTMAQDPTKDPETALKECKDYWQQRDADRDHKLCTLVQHQGSLYYSSPTSLDFTFNKDMDEASAFCSAENNDPCACK